MSLLSLSLSNLLLLLFSLPCLVVPQSIPSSEWNVTSATVISLHTEALIINVTINIEDVSVLYVILPLPESSTLFPYYLDSPSYPAPNDTMSFLSYFTDTSNDVTAVGEMTLIVDDNDDQSYILNITEESTPEQALAVLVPSAVFSVFFLVANMTSVPIDYSSVLTNASTSALSVPAGCVIIPSSNLNQCVYMDPSLLIVSDLNPYLLDGVALLEYQQDVSLYNGDDCANQHPNVSICNNCLAIRARWHCAQQFGNCITNDIGSPQTVGPCQWLCNEKNDRCSEQEDCNVYATYNCNGAHARRGMFLMLLTMPLLSLLLYLFT